MAIELNLRSWAAWAPALSSEEEFTAWARGEKSWGTEGVADISFLPPLLRRRLTPLARSGLYAINECLHRGKCLPAEIPTVFASRYGENDLTLTLLREIIRDEAVSPMRFAMSVHNSIGGLFSIGANNRAPSTALAGGRETFFNALLEAHARLVREPELPVLVVAYEEPLDPVYDDFADEFQVPYALALLLERDGSGPLLRGTRGGQGFPAPGSRVEPAALAFLRWWLTGDEALHWGAKEAPWHWNRLAAALP